MNRFLADVARALEVDAVSQETAFRQCEGWCSLKAFGLLVLLENDWGAPVTLAEFQTLRTVRDLYRVAFVAFAAEVLQVPRTSLSGATERGTLPEWDSIGHLRLVMEAERRFGVRYPLESVADLRRLDDFLVS